MLWNLFQWESAKTIAEITGSSADVPFPPTTQKPPLPKVMFSRTIFLEGPTQNDAIEGDAMYVIAQRDKSRWVLFQCPCKCGAVITLSLQRVHNPHWSVTHTESGRCTLYPSVWRDQGCLSHFVVRDGRVFWARDSGTLPQRRFGVGKPPTIS